MKKYFVTGLVLLLPLAMTMAIVIFVFNFLTKPFVGIFKSILGHYGLLEQGFLFLSPEQTQEYLSQLIILALLFFFTVSLGAVTRWFFINYLIHLWDYMLHRIPFVSTIYKTSQDVIKTLFANEAKSFKQVVLVHFPNPNTYSIGLVTRENLPDLEKGSLDEFVTVFVPTTPNPTSGFLVLCKAKELIYLDMKVEDAFKYVISCGVIGSPFQQIKHTQQQP